MSLQPIEIIRADLSRPDHQEATLELLNAYMTDEMGGGNPMPASVREALIGELRRHPAFFILLAAKDDRYIGLATCFIGFSTFHAKKLVNIHDLAVLPEYRGVGVGRQLMKGVEREARRLDCCKVTLEVRSDNSRAQALYASEGYKESSPPMFFWHKYL